MFSKISHSKKFYPLSFLTGVLLPIFLWICFSFYSSQIDLKISKFFYVEGHFDNHAFWHWVYTYGIWPGWLLVIAALIGFCLSFSRSFYHWRRPCLFLILTLALGSGLLIHAGFKDQWGRPRPRQVEEFGGKQVYRSYYHPNFGIKTEAAKSFASGHASIGFYFFSLALLGTIYQSRFWYWMGIILGWGLGGLLSVTRIAQGGHFFSDTLASALIMWLTAWTLAYFFFIRPLSKEVY